MAVGAATILAFQEASSYASPALFVKCTVSGSPQSVFALSTVLYALDDQASVGSISAEYWDETSYQAVSNSKLSTTSTVVNSSAVFATKTLMQAQFTVVPATTTLVIKFVVASALSGSRDFFGVGDVRVEYPLPATTTQAPPTTPLPPGITNAPPTTTTTAAGTLQPPGVTTVTSESEHSFNSFAESVVGEPVSSVAPVSSTVGVVIGVVVVLAFLIGVAIAVYCILKRRRDEPDNDSQLPVAPSSKHENQVSGHYATTSASFTHGISRESNYSLINEKQVFGHYATTGASFTQGISREPNYSLVRDEEIKS